MFNKDKVAATIAIDSTSKPFWTTGDAISGSVRIVVDTKLVLSSVQVSLVCDEVGIVATTNGDLEKYNNKKPKTRRIVKKRTITHYSTSQTLLDAQTQAESAKANLALVLSQGEYVFPFAIDLNDDINSCPPHAPVKTRGNINLGVKWYLKLTVKRKAKLQPNLKVTELMPVYPRSITSMMSVNTMHTNELLELSGEHSSKSKFNLFGSKKPNLKLICKLKYPSTGLMQRPKMTPFSLTLGMSEGEAQLHSVSLNLVRTCECTVYGLTDVYTTEHMLGTVNVSRHLTVKPVDLSALIRSFQLQETMAPAFSAKMLNIKYALQLTIKYSVEDDKKLNTFKIANPTDVIAPYLCWAGANLPLSLSPQQVAFQEPENAQDKARSAFTGRTSTTGTTLSSIGTVTSYEIKRPTDVISGWFGKWS